VTSNLAPASTCIGPVAEAWLGLPTAMPSSSYIIATAGHVDHGKSTLIEALSGINPDRLPEERKRGMTIELGFAHLSLLAGDQTFELGLIDVPGHADFVKNMVAGVGCIDAALLVVAADDGWMPQTEEHLQILLYLGVRHAVVALTKSDVCQDLPATLAEIRQQLQGTPLADSEIIPVCALAGDGLPELTTALGRVLQTLPAVANQAKPRLFIDRAFSPKGAGTVVTGSLSGGTLAIGDAVVVQPRGIKTRIRGLQNHGRQVETSGPGTRTAVQLHDVALSVDGHEQGVRRGDVLTLAALGSPSRVLDVEIWISPRSAATKPLASNAQVTVHLGSASSAGRLHFITESSLELGQRALAQLRLDEPLFAFAGDRLVLRDVARQLTLAGALVLDPTAHPRRFRQTRQLDLLEARRQSPTSPQVWLQSLVRRDHAVPTAHCLAQSLFEVTAELPDEVEPSGDWLVHAPWWQQVLSTAAGLIHGLHQASPQLVGMKLSDLRTALEKQLPDKRFFDLVLDRLTETGFVRSAGTLRAVGHAARLPPELQAAGSRLRQVLAAVPEEPPNLKELTPGPTDLKAMTFLIDTGEVVVLDERTVLLTTAYESLKAKIRQLLQVQQRATVAEIRETTGTTRRILVPLLERLDKETFTRRDGDYRYLRISAK
jgi:selenocysteine-specific elongation factor